MEFLRHSLAQIRAQLSMLTATQRWLILSLTIVLLMTGFLLVQWSAAPQMVAIDAFVGEPHRVVANLKARRIDVQTDAGQILVPHAQQLRALEILAQSNLLVDDTAAAFDKLVEGYTPWLSNEQHHQMLIIAKQKVLGQISGKMKGVRSADIMVSQPAKRGFADSHVQPSAAVNVVMEPGKAVTSHLVDALAGLVSGAVAGIRHQDVVIIDANRGQQFTTRDKDDVLPGETLALIKQIEQHHHAKLSRVLGYIQGVIVAVHVQTDPIIKQEVTEYDYQKEDQLASEFSRESQRKDTASEGEPGPRANTGIQIPGGLGTQSEQQVDEIRNEYRDRKITRQTGRVETGHNAKLINVSVNVPRNYLVSVFRSLPANVGDASAEPDDTFIQFELDKIRTSVEPLIETSDGKGMVRVQAIPDPQVLASMLGGPAASSGLLQAASGWVKPVGIGALALFSLALMFGMVRKATRQAPLPSVDELSGLPPSLGEEDAMVGEANQSDPAITGVELPEGELRSRKIAEQINELVKSNPEEVGTLIKQWVRPEQ